MRYKSTEKKKQVFCVSVRESHMERWAHVENDYGAKREGFEVTILRNSNMSL